VCYLHRYFAHFMRVLNVGLKAEALAAQRHRPCFALAVSCVWWIQVLLLVRVGSLRWRLPEVPPLPPACSSPSASTCSIRQTMAHTSDPSLCTGEAVGGRPPTAVVCAAGVPAIDCTPSIEAWALFANLGASKCLVGSAGGWWPGCLAPGALQRPDKMLRQPPSLHRVH
jgi:hypothetical protein